jgi:pyruvate formate lyase activating enzyme
MLDHLGLIKTTLIDFPGRVASTLFTHGCHFRCPYCHNPELLGRSIPTDFLAREEILTHLDRRRKVLGGVCITGGEPLLHADLPELCAEIRERGLAVKVDTNGAFPDRLSALLQKGLVDYVAIDIKTAFDHYDRVGGNGGDVRSSVGLIQESGVEHEFRTTVVPGIVDSDDIHSISEVLTSEDLYVLAQFRPGNTLDPRFSDLEPYRSERLREWQHELTERGLRCELRGVN